MNVYKLVEELEKANLYLAKNNISCDPELIVFVDSNGVAIQMDEIDVSINGNCIQLMVK